MRSGAPTRLQEPVMPDGASLDRVTRIVLDHGRYREGIGPQGIQGETELRGDLQRQIEVPEVIPGHVRKTGTWRRGDLDQILHALRLEAVRVEPFRSCRLLAPPQEWISKVAWLTPLVHEEKFLLQPHPANREVLRQGPVPARRGVNVRGVCQHLYRVPFPYRR